MTPSPRPRSVLSMKRTLLIALLALGLILLAVGAWTSRAFAGRFAAGAIDASASPRHSSGHGREAGGGIALGLVAVDTARRRHAAARCDAPRPASCSASGDRVDRITSIRPGSSRPDGKPLPVIARLVHAGRDAGLSDDRLYEVLTARTGISGDARLADALRDGKDEYVLSVVRSG